jgi:hypothetical protein
MKNQKQRTHTDRAKKITNPHSQQNQRNTKNSNKKSKEKEKKKRKAEQQFLFKKEKRSFKGQSPFCLYFCFLYTKLLFFLVAVKKKRDFNRINLSFFWFVEFFWFLFDIVF